MSRTISEIEADIRSVLETRVAPKLALHRGGSELESFDPETGIATIRFVGTCVGCPLSTMTLKMGVEDELLNAVPEVQEVRAAGVDEESLEFIADDDGV